jgi:hypothetical protein
LRSVRHEQPGPTRGGLPEARQFRRRDPGIDDQRVGPAVDDDRQVPEQVAPEDEEPVRDGHQHVIP